VVQQWLRNKYIFPLLEYIAKSKLSSGVKGLIVKRQENNRSLARSCPSINGNVNCRSESTAGRHPGRVKYGCAYIFVPEIENNIHMSTFFLPHVFPHFDDHITEALFQFYLDGYLDGVNKLQQSNDTQAPRNIRPPFCQHACRKLFDSLIVLQLFRNIPRPASSSVGMCR
jgi:hypothetical protein